MAIRPLTLALLCWLAAPLVAQRAPSREVQRPMEFLTGQDDNLFSLRRSQEDIHEWELALGELENGEANAAVERLHKLLLNEIGGVAPVGDGRYLGLRCAVVTTLANLAPAGQQAYEALVTREAGHLAQRPLPELLQDQLALLADRYPTSAIGRSARMRLGDLALEAGDGVTATGHYRQGIDAAPIGSSAEQSLIARLAVARTLIEPRTARAAAASGHLDATAAEVLSVLPAATDPSGYRAAGGGSDGRTPMTTPVGTPVTQAGEQILAPGFERRESGLYAMIPVGDLDGVYINTGRDLRAFDPLRGQPLWTSVAPLGESARGFGGNEAGEVNPDMVLAAAYGGDTVIAALQVPERGTNVDFHNNFRIISKIPQRRLFAFSRTTGKLLWAHFDELDGPRSRRFRGHDVCAPPLVAGDTVFVPIHDRAGAIAFSVAAYDLATGAPKWRRLVCSSQQEVNMFGNARMEFAAAPICLSDGVIYGASNLGIVYAIDAATGQTRWVAAHEVVRMPTASLRRQQERAVYFINNTPIVADGVLCVTPLDSPYVIGIDAESGRTLWQLPADAPVLGVENDVRWLCGVFGDEFLLTGRGAVAVKARPEQTLGLQPTVRQLVPPEVFRHITDGPVSGRPAVTKDHVWVGRSGSITGFDRAGNSIATARQIRVPRYQGGNLLFVDGIVVSMRLGALEVMLDRTAVLTQVEERYRQTPDDPAAILRLATLRAALLNASSSAEEHRAVTALYRAGIEVCSRRGLPKAHPVRAALQRELFDQAIKAANAAIASADRNTLDLLAEARDAAPDTRAWLRVQELVLEQCADNAKRLASELDRLEREAAGAMMPLPGGEEPVRAYVLFRRTMLPGLAPTDAVAIWQELLENYGSSTFAGEAVPLRAVAAIAELITRHGEACYAAIAERADAALLAAGNEVESLRAVGARFPNSRAASRARTRLLDSSVERGDLGSACEVLAQELTRERPNPGVLRRVLVAAKARQNLGLARAMADRLAAHAATVSDWPADQQQTYGAVLKVLAPELAAEPAKKTLGLPLHEVARIKPRSPREAFQLVTVLHDTGFPVPPDAPLYVKAGADLCAIDLHHSGPQKPILFAVPVQFLEHVVLCGTTLIVPDLERAFAIDYRTGELRWELPHRNGRLLDGLGVQNGVFHLSAQPTDGEGPGEFLGIEPVSGRVLFSRSLPGERMRPVPKPIAGQLLVMQSAADGGAVLLRLDPVSGLPLQRIELAASLLQQQTESRNEELATRIYPQWLSGDMERIYLPIDSTFSGDAPRLFAVDNRGTVVWRWLGQQNTRLLMAARIDDRIVIVEGSEDQQGRVSTLEAKTGEVILATPIGYDIDVLNWQRGWLQNPAPRALLLSDVASPTSRDRRFFCIGVAGDMPSFVEALSSQQGEIERQPQIGTDFVTFGVRPARRGPFRLYSLRLADRSGALPGGQKYQSLSIDPTYALSAVGPYTVLCCAEYLVVLGPEATNR